VSTVDLGPVRLRLGEPVLVYQGVGHAWFPVIDRFPGGELMALWSMMPDVHVFSLLGGISHSADGGRTWTDPYDVGNWTSVRHALPDGTLRCVPYYIYPRPRGQARTFATHLIAAHPGGRREIEPFGVQVVGLPQPVKIQHTGAAAFNFDGNVLERDGHWLTTLYGTWEGDEKATLVLAASGDLGGTWEYRATIASHTDVPDAPEGPDEASLVELDSGDLLCVYRVGSGLPWRYHASRSGDGGRTWSQPRALDGPYSVEPCLQRLANGVLALSGGRPGLHLWLCTDGAGQAWQEFDVQAHHNRTCGNAAWHMAQDGSQTTAYTELLEVAPNRLLMIYDRIPLGWDEVPLDSAERNMIFVVDITVQRQ